MRIAIMGIRGIPAKYGGFETFAEELAPRLVERGHDVTVYGRKHVITWPESHYKGVRLVVLPTIPTKHLDTPVHTIVSCVHAIGEGYDAVLVCNAANALFVSLLRMTGTPVALNVDGIERLRKKWGRAGRGWFWMSEYLATKIPTAIVADAGVIQAYYRDKWHAASTMIPYGASTQRAETIAALEQFGVTPRDYILVVARLEPENNIDLVIRAFAKVKTDKRLVVVGDVPYASEYKQLLHELAAQDDRVIMTGAVYGDGYREFQSNSYCYIQAADVGGTSPALLEGMAMGGCVVVNGTDQNREVIGDTGWWFSSGDVDEFAERLQYLVDNPGEAEAARGRARERIDSVYSWPAVTDAYENLLASIARKRR